jgi:hypothetical protein
MSIVEEIRDAITDAEIDYAADVVDECADYDLDDMSVTMTVGQLRAILALLAQETT